MPHHQTPARPQTARVQSSRRSGVVAGDDSDENHHSNNQRELPPQTSRNNKNLTSSRPLNPSKINTADSSGSERNTPRKENNKDDDHNDGNDPTTIIIENTSSDKNRITGAETTKNREDDQELAGESPPLFAIASSSVSKDDFGVRSTTSTNANNNIRTSSSQQQHQRRRGLTAIGGSHQHQHQQSRKGSNVSMKMSLGGANNSTANLAAGGTSFRISSDPKETSFSVFAGASSSSSMNTNITGASNNNNKKKRFGQNLTFAQQRGHNLESVSGSILHTVRPLTRKEDPSIPEFYSAQVVERKIQNTKTISCSGTQTEFVPMKTTGQNHKEGGWPSSIESLMQTNESSFEEESGKYLKRVLREDKYGVQLGTCVNKIMASMRCNAAIDIYSMAFSQHFDELQQRQDQIVESYAPYQQQQTNLTTSKSSTAAGNNNNNNNSKSSGITSSSSGAPATTTTTQNKTTASKDPLQEAQNRLAESPIALPKYLSLVTSSLYDIPQPFTDCVLSSIAWCPGVAQVAALAFEPTEQLYANYAQLVGLEKFYVPLALVIDVDAAKREMLRSSAQQQQQQQQDDENDNNNNDDQQQSAGGKNNNNRSSSAASPNNKNNPSTNSGQKTSSSSATAGSSSSKSQTILCAPIDAGSITSITFGLKNGNAFVLAGTSTGGVLMWDYRDRDDVNSLRKVKEEKKKQLSQLGGGTRRKKRLAAAAASSLAGNSTLNMSNTSSSLPIPASRSSVSGDIQHALRQHEQQQQQHGPAATIGGMLSRTGHNNTSSTQINTNNNNNNNNIPATSPYNNNTAATRGSTTANSRLFLNSLTSPSSHHHHHHQPATDTLSNQSSAGQYYNNTNNRFGITNNNNTNNNNTNASVFAKQLASLNRFSDTWIAPCGSALPPLVESHRTSVVTVRAIPGRTQQEEFVSVGSDGAILQWDSRYLSSGPQTALPIANVMPSETSLPFAASSSASWNNNFFSSSSSASASHYHQQEKYLDGDDSFVLPPKEIALADKTTTRRKQQQQQQGSHDLDTKNNMGGTSTMLGESNVFYGASTTTQQPNLDDEPDSDNDNDENGDNNQNEDDDKKHPQEEGLGGTANELSMSMKRDATMRFTGASADNNNNKTKKRSSSLSKDVFRVEGVKYYGGEDYEDDDDEDEGSGGGSRFHDNDDDEEEEELEDEDDFIEVDREIFPSCVEFEPNVGGATRVMVGDSEGSLRVISRLQNIQPVITTSPTSPGSPSSPSSPQSAGAGAVTSIFSSSAANLMSGSLNSGPGQFLHGSKSSFGHSSVLMVMPPSQMSRKDTATSAVVEGGGLGTPQMIDAQPIGASFGSYPLGSLPSPKSSNIINDDNEHHQQHHPDSNTSSPPHHHHHNLSPPTQSSIQIEAAERYRDHLKMKQIQQQGLLELTSSLDTPHFGSLRHLSRNPHVPKFCATFSSTDSTSGFCLLAEEARVLLRVGFGGVGSFERVESLQHNNVNLMMNNNSLMNRNSRRKMSPKQQQQQQLSPNTSRSGSASAAFPKFGKSVRQQHQNKNIDDNNNNNASSASLFSGVGAASRNNNNNNTNPENNNMTSSSSPSSSLPAAAMVGLTTLSWHPLRPALLIGGTSNGELHGWDLGKSFTEPVWTMKLFPKNAHVESIDIHSQGEVAFVTGSLEVNISSSSSLDFNNNNSGAGGGGTNNDQQQQQQSTTNPSFNGATSMMMLQQSMIAGGGADGGASFSSSPNRNNRRQSMMFSGIGTLANSVFLSQDIGNNAAQSINLSRARRNTAFAIPGSFTTSTGGAASNFLQQQQQQQHSTAALQSLNALATLNSSSLNLNSIMAMESSFVNNTSPLQQQKILEASLAMHQQQQQQQGDGKSFVDNSSFSMMFMGGGKNNASFGNFQTDNNNNNNNDTSPSQQQQHQQQQPTITTVRRGVVAMVRFPSIEEMLVRGFTSNNNNNTSNSTATTGTNNNTNTTTNNSSSNISVLSPQIASRKRADLQAERTILVHILDHNLHVAKTKMQQEQQQEKQRRASFSLSKSSMGVSNTRNKQNIKKPSFILDDNHHQHQHQESVNRKAHRKYSHTNNSDENENDDEDDEINTIVIPSTDLARMSSQTVDVVRDAADLAETYLTGVYQKEVNEIHEL